MSKHLNCVRGQRFTQSSLNNDFRDTAAGQTALSKCLLITLSTCLASLSGIFAGVTGGFISLYTVFPRAIEQRLIFFWVALVIATCIFQTLRRSFLQGLQVATLVSVVALPISAVILGKLEAAFAVAILFFSSLLCSTAFLSLLTGSLSLSLVSILLDRPQKPARIYIVLTTVITAIFSYLLIGSLQSQASVPNQAGLASLAIVTGLVFGGGAVAVSLYVIGSQQFESLRMWAISIGCWRGTSFHNLDLSRISFRNANLANTDLRAQKLYRTCFQDVDGLNRAKVDNRYLDLGEPKVQQLLTRGCSSVLDFCRSNLQGAYLQRADMRGFDLTDANLTGADLKGADLRDSILRRTQLADADFQGVDLRKNILIDANLTGADLRGADLRGSILVRAQAARADFTEADLTGVCIEDWSVSSKTRFTDVRCDYIYRKYQDGQPRDRYPVDRNFEPGEFASLFAEPEDEVELVFKGEFNIAALSLALYKLQTDAPELNLELRGVEQREKLWVAKIKSTSSLLNERLIEERLTSVYQDPSNGSITVEETIKNSIYRDYEETKHRLAESEQLVRQLAGVTGSQAEALKELSKQSFGNSFFITGSTITNLAGSGQIEYHEAADQVRSLVTNSADPGQVIPILQNLFMQLSEQRVATTSGTQLEFIQQLIVAEAEKDQAFKQFLTQHEPQIISAMPSGAIATAIQSAIHTVNSKLP